MIPLNAYLSRALLRLTWLAALWAYPRGLISLETFLRVDDAYYRRLIIEGWRRAA